MKRLSVLALLVLILAAQACSSNPSAASEPTATFAPLNTHIPTDTRLPTDTSTPPPTATPDFTATAAASATQSAAAVLNELDKLLGDTDVPYKDGHLAWQQHSTLNIQMSGPDYKILGIDKNLTAGNFIFKSDVTWEASGLLICGAIFRSEPSLEEGKQYQFVYLRLSGLPAWSIEVYQFGNYLNSPVKTKTSGAINLNNGAKNQFVLVVQDDNFTLYLNDAYQGRYYDYSKQRTDGAFGFLGYQDSGKGKCEFENSWVWSLD